MTRRHHLHKHPDLPPGWWIAVAGEDRDEPIPAVRYKATIFDINWPYCAAYGDTQGEAENRAVLLFRLMQVEDTQGEIT